MTKDFTKISEPARYSQTFYLLEYKKGYLSKKTDKPLFVWDLGEGFEQAKKFADSIMNDDINKDYMFVQEIYLNPD